MTPARLPPTRSTTACPPRSTRSAGHASVGCAEYGATGRHAERKRSPPKVTPNPSIRCGPCWEHCPRSCIARTVGATSLPTNTFVPATIACSTRYATAAQISALRVRDEGYALCGRDASDCEAHHVTPFHAPARGRTNTDEMVLADPDCHHHIHANNLTLSSQPHPTRKGKLLWKLRPATPDELPP